MRWDYPPLGISPVFPGLIIINIVIIIVIIVIIVVIIIVIIIVILLLLFLTESKIFYILQILKHKS